MCNVTFRIYHSLTSAKCTLAKIVAGVFPGVVVISTLGSYIMILGYDHFILGSYIKLQQPIFSTDMLFHVRNTLALAIHLGVRFYVQCY